MRRRAGMSSGALVRVERGAAIERRMEFPVLVGHRDLRIAAVPRERRRDEGLPVFAEVAPVLLVRLVDDQPVREPRVADRPGRIEGRAAAVLAVPERRRAERDRVVALELRLLGDDVDHAARVHQPVQQRRRSLQHLDAVDRRVERAPLHERHPVLHDRAVAVAAEAALHDRVLRARERVALRDAADVAERVVQVARPLVAQHLRGHDVDGLRGVEQQDLGTQHARFLWRAIAFGAQRTGAHVDRGQLGARRDAGRRGPCDRTVRALERVAAARLPQRDGRCPRAGGRARRRHRSAPARRRSSGRRSARPETRAGCPRRGRTGSAPLRAARPECRTRGAPLRGRRRIGVGVGQRGQRQQRRQAPASRRARRPGAADAADASDAAGRDARAADARTAPIRETDGNHDREVGGRWASAAFITHVTRTSRNSSGQRKYF